ncbi:hypothetical protein [Deinococcus cavernae]|uniref:hypothetical protein n=1 Tax=Deinococcus cavernae TaxID=2320857 RepID=UPI001F18C14C|nr:hypothetical protein [Deinococcus cavernae]
MLGRQFNLTGFAKTALLRRISSSLEAGYISVSRMLHGEAVITDEETEEDEEEVTVHTTDEMRRRLEELKWALGRTRSQDPRSNSPSTC